MTENAEGEKRKVTHRRLLLSKQMYLHGIELSKNTGALSKMIAVHNFHNAIEITLKAIFLYHEIRAEKQLNIEFEQMLAEIDNHQPFKDAGKKLPYRQDMRNLNQIRNLVQHHAVEPETSVMDEWRVFTKRFLERACKEYFDLDFNKLSAISLINNEQIREIFEKINEEMKKADWNKAAKLLRIVFECAINSITNILPSEGFNSSFFVTSQYRHDRELRHLAQTIEMIYSRIRSSEFYAALLASGISSVNLDKLKQKIPHAEFAVDGTPYFNGKMDYTEDDCLWAFNFIVNFIIELQLQGLEPVFNENTANACNKVFGDKVQMQVYVPHNE